MAPRVFDLRRPALPSALVALAGAALVSAACSSDGGDTPGVTHPTMIEVNPADFLGQLPCSNEAGSVRRYVATLFDVTGDGAGGSSQDEAADGQGCGGFQLPSSEPTRCSTSVGFGYVVAGRRYCVEVDGYDSDAIEPRGTGIRQMVEGNGDDDAPPAADAASVSPSWTARCEGAQAFGSTVVRAAGCDAFDPQPDPSAPSEVVLSTAELLGDFECGSEPGQVEELTLTARYSGQPASEQTFLCGEEPRFSGLPGNTSLTIDVVARGSGGVLAGASCHALTVPGTTVVAQCTRLNAFGTLRVDLESSLALVGYGCDASISDVRVQVMQDGFERRLPPPDCLQPFDHGFAAGDPAVVTLTIVPREAEPITLACSGAVAPGALVIATCEEPGLAPI